MNQPIRVLIVDDHTLFRSGIKALLQRHEDFEVVGEASDGLEGLKRQIPPARRGAARLAHAGIGGREAVKLLSRSAGVQRAVADQAEDLIETICRRPGLFAEKHRNRFLLNAIRSPQRRVSGIDADPTGKLMMGVRMGGRRSRKTTRENSAPAKRDHRPAAKGIAQQGNGTPLNVAESTVKIHVQNILKKLHLTSRVQAAVYAVEHGLVQKD
jgi:two-component system nitrate/nitrite response regulator NarL